MELLPIYVFLTVGIGNPNYCRASYPVRQCGFYINSYLKSVRKICQWLSGFWVVGVLGPFAVPVPRTFPTKAVLLLLSRFSQSNSV